MKYFNLVSVSKSRAATKTGLQHSSLNDLLKDFDKNLFEKIVVLFASDLVTGSKSL